MRIYTFKNLQDHGWPYSRVHTRRLVKAGKCPAPAGAGDNRLIWNADEWDGYLRDRFSNREASAARRSAVAKARRDRMLTKSKSRAAANGHDIGNPEA